MTVECLIFSFLFLEDAKFLQTLPSKGCLAQLALTFTILAMLVQNLQKVLRDELRWVKLLAFESCSIVEGRSVVSCGCIGTLSEDTIF